MANKILSKYDLLNDIDFEAHLQTETDKKKTLWQYFVII